MVGFKKSVINGKTVGRVLFYTLVTALAYFFSAKLVAPLSLSESSSIFAIWPPTGIALSFLFFRGYAVVPGIFLGAFFLNMTLSSALVAFEIAIGNTIGPAVAYWFILNSDGKENIFYDTDTVISFVVYGAIGAFITATMGTTMLHLNGLLAPVNQMLGWLVWFFGDFIGFLMVVPIFAASALYRNSQGTVKEESIKIVFIFLLFFVAVIIMFAEASFFNQEYPFEYLILVPLIWASIRFQYGISRMFLAIFIVLALLGTVLGYSNFSFEGDYRLSLLLLQFFIFTVNFLILLMTAQHFESIRMADESEQ